MKDVADDLALIVRNAIDYINKLEQQINELKRKPVQEPEPGEYHGWVLREVLFDNGEPVGHREPVQKPVAWWHRKSDTFTSGNLVSKFDEWTPLYTAPLQRKWTGLTEAERVDIIDDEITEQNSEHWALAQAIEAALKKVNT